jgi:tetratricopeptide (TPR) repeat protein
MRVLCSLMVCGLVAGGLAPPARGQRRVDPATEAKAHYELGVTAYGLGHFDRALAAFTRAYRLDPAPILLYNIAQAHRKLGNREEAIQHYRRYLDAVPGANDRQQIQARIREMESGPGLRAAADQDPVPPPIEPGKPALIAPMPAETAAMSLPASALPAVGTGADTTVVERPVYRRPWFWSVVGAASLAVIAGVFLLRPEDHWSCGPADCNLPTRTVP